MKNLKVLGNSYLCRKIEKEERLIDKNGILLKEKAIPIFKIIDKGTTLDEDFNLGDSVVVSSTGTEILVDGEKLFLFKPEHILGKII